MIDEYEFVFFDGEREVIHLIGATGAGEFTACGIAFDIESDEPNLGKCVITKKQKITCQDCNSVIKFYKKFNSRYLEKIDKKTYFQDLYIDGY